MTTRTLKLDTILSTPKDVEANGEKYPLRSVTPRVMYTIDAATKTEDQGEKMRLYCDALAVLIPTMPRVLIDDLSGEQIVAILEFASADVTDVEAAVTDPNADSSAPLPATERAETPT